MSSWSRRSAGEIGAENFLAGARGERLPGGRADRIADQTQATVTEQQIDAAGVTAAGSLQAEVVRAVQAIERRRVRRQVVVVGGREIAAVDPPIAALTGRGR